MNNCMAWMKIQKASIMNTYVWIEKIASGIESLLHNRVGCPLHHWAILNSSSWVVYIPGQVDC